MKRNKGRNKVEKLI